MPRFVIVFDSAAAPRLDSPRSYNFESPAGLFELAVVPVYETDPLGTPHITSTVFECRSDAPDISSAWQVGQAIADVALVAMVLSTPMWSEPLVPRLAYQIDGAAPFEFEQLIDAWMPGYPARTLDVEAFESVIGSIWSAGDETRWRTSHAANTFRHALRAEDPTLRIPTTYSGLDILDPLLAMRFPYTGPGQSKGVGGFLQAQSIEFEEAVRKARRKLVHGHAAISEIAEELNAVDRPLVGALRDAVFGELGLAPPEWEPSDIDSPGARGKPQLHVRAHLTPSDSGAVAADGSSHPYFDVKWRQEASSLDEAGKYRTTLTPLLTARLADGARLTKLELGMRQIPGASVALTDPKVLPKDGATPG